MNCKNCNQEEAVKYSKYTSGEFCSRECARAYSTKLKRNEINKKVSKTMTGSGNGNVVNICCDCKKEFEVEWRRRSRKYCSADCFNNREYTQETREKIGKKSKERCGTIDGRKRMRDIGRKGGFGKKGYTKFGTYYQSSIEQVCFEFLEENKIKFTPHKNIPNSSKVSDVYLDEKNLWVEIDGIDREKRSKWLEEEYKYWKEKLEIYKKENLNFKIVKSFKEFKEIFN